MRKRKEPYKWFADDFRLMPEKVQDMFFEYLFKNADFKNGDITNVFGLVELVDLPTECESPIEQILLYALDLFGFFYSNGTVYTFSPQAEVIVEDKTYRADLLFESYDYSDIEYRLIIECDGHEFHEKTKAQVTKRNDRDLDLMDAGYEVIHLNGSQIFNNPMKYAKQIYNLIDKRLG